MPSGESPRRTELVRASLGSFAAWSLILVCSVWQGYDMSAPFANHSFLREAEFGVAALVFQLCGLYSLRLDLLSGLLSQALASLLLASWAIGLVAPYSPLHTIWRTFGDFLQFVATAIMVWQMFFVFRDSERIRHASDGFNGSASGSSGLIDR